MAVNATEVLYLTSGLFKAVPSKAVLTDLVKFNGNIEGLAASLGTSPYAVNAFPFSNAEKAKTLAENLLGSSVAADAKAAATTALEGVLNANGGNVGIAAVVAIKEILKGGTYADAKAQLENRVKVAAAYVDSNKGNEISTSVLDAVTKDAATVTTAINSLTGTTGGNEAGADRVLTTAQDILTGTAGNDNFRAVAGATQGTQDQTTLNSSDIIDGAAGTNDTLIVNLVNGGAAANYGGGARIKGIETLKLGTNNSATFDYNVNQGQNEITDVTTIVADQINTGETLTVNNLVRDAADKALPTLSWINDSTAINGLAGTVAVNYRAAAVSGTADEQAVSLTNVRAGTLNLAAGVEKVTLTSAGTATNSIDKVQSGTTLTDVVIKADAQLGGNREVSAAAATAGTAGMEINRTALNTNDKHLSFVNMGSSVKNVTAEGSKAAVHVAFTDTATDNTFKGGDGNDVVILNGGNDKFEGGKGDDTVIFRQTSTSSNGSFFNNSDTLDGGEGKDTILIDYAKDSTSSLNQVVIQTSEWLNSKGLDVLDLRATNTRTVLEDAFVGRADAGSFEVVTNKIVQNDSTSSVADEANSTHQIDLTNVSATRNIKVTGGEGRETVIVTDALNGTSTLSGGNGLDTLVVQNGATLTGQDLQNVTGFNTINLVKTGTTAQTFNIDLTADFLTKAVDSNVNAGTTKNTSNAFAIVTDAQDGARNTMNGVQILAAGDVVNVTVDVTGLGNNVNAVDLRDIVNAGATLVVRNTSGTVLFSNQAGNLVTGTGVWAGLNGGGASVAYNAVSTPIVGAGTPVHSGQASTGGGAAPVAGNTFTLTAAGAVVATGAAATNATLVTGTNTGTTANKDIINGLSFSTATIADSTTGDADEYNVNVIGAIAPTAVSGIENINLTLNAGGNFNAAGVVTAANQAINVVTGTGTVSALTAAHNVGINAGHAGTVTLQSAATTGSGNMDFTVALNGAAGTVTTLDSTGAVAGATANVLALSLNANSTLTAINHGTGAVTLQGTAAGSTLTANLGTVTAASFDASGNTYAGAVTGTFSTVTYNGSAGVDTLSLSGTNTVTTGAGADVITVTGGTTTFGTTGFTMGTDTLTINAGATASITAAGAGALTSSLITNNGTLNLIGSAGGDVITGTAGNDYIVGNAGNDTLAGLAGNNVYSFLSAAGAAPAATGLTVAAGVGSDVISTFTVANDQFELDESIFGVMGNGATGAGATLNAAQFASLANLTSATNGGAISGAGGALDVTGNGAIVYIQSTGGVYFIQAGATLTAGGIATMAAGEVALIGTITTLTGTLAATDFNIVA